MKTNSEVQEPVSLSPMQRFWRLLKPDIKEIQNVYIYAIFSGLVALTLPLGIQAIINLIQGGQVSTSWIVLVAVVVAGVATSGILQIYQLRITESLQQKIFTRAAFELAFRIPRIKMEQLYKHYAPELMNRFFDTISVQKGLAKILVDFSAAALQVILGLILLSFYHPFFIAFSLILIVLIYAIFKFTAGKGLSTSLVESKRKYKVAHWLEETARTLQVFRMAGNPTLPIDRVDEHVEDYLEARQAHFKVLVQQYSLMVVFKVVVALGLLAIGGILVMQQLMNVGQFVAAEIIILLVMSSVEKLIMSLETIYDVLTSLEKIGQVSDLELEPEGGVDIATHCEEGGLSLQIEGVDFYYPDNKQPMLRNVVLNVASGEKVLIVGASGSGKSTLLQVVAGLFAIQRGHISYNGYALGEVSMSSLRKVVGDGLSKQLLFEGTIWENISLGRPAVSREDAQEVIIALGLNEFVRKSQNGVNTLLDPLGAKLPDAIVRRLLLARALVDRPKLLLLETQLLDFPPAEQKAILDYLLHPDRKCTIVATGDLPSLAKRVDKVVAMEKGQIIAQGGYDVYEKLTTPKSDSDA